MSKRPWNDSEYDSTWISRLIASEVMTPLPERSVARRSLAICALADRSSVDVAADVLVSGVPMALPLAGVDADVPVVVLASSPLPAFAAAFAACERISRQTVARLCPHLLSKALGLRGADLWPSALRPRRSIAHGLAAHFVRSASARVERVVGLRTVQGPQQRVLSSFEQSLVDQRRAPQPHVKSPAPARQALPRALRLV